MDTKVYKTVENVISHTKYPMYQMNYLNVFVQNKVIIQLQVSQ